MSGTSSELQELYAAYSYSYSTEANRRHLTFVIDGAFAAVASLLAIVSALDEAGGLQHWLTTWLPLMALTWLAVRETGMVADDQTARRTAVTIQEQFDLMFWKPTGWKRAWNSFLCGPPIQRRRIKELALKYDRQPFDAGYWVDTGGLDPNAAALFRIEQAAAWGARGHARYARLNYVPTVVTVIVVLVLSAIANLGSRDTAAILAAAAPFLVGRLQSARDHGQLAARREALEKHIEEARRPDAAITDGDVRHAQDELCRLRLEHRRIPSWLYKRYNDQDCAAIDAALDASVREYRDAVLRPRNEG